MSPNSTHRLIAAAAPKQGAVLAAEDDPVASEATASSISNSAKPKRQSVKAACNACQRRKVKVCVCVCVCVCMRMYTARYDMPSICQIMVWPYADYSVVLVQW